MSESREASWYEIALTHSQIVKIFVVLLLCLVAAFFSGVWIGRDGSPVEMPAIALDSLPDEVENGDVAQLNFFDREGEELEAEPAEPQPAIEAVGAETTLVDDLQSEPEGAPERRPAAPARPEPSESLIARAAEAGERRKAEPSGPDAPVAVTRETQGASSDATGDLVVQVFSSNDADQARRVLGRLSSGGHPAFLSPVEVDGRTMYRVRIGPYSERAAAERVADNVKRTFKLDTWITSKST